MRCCGARRGIQDSESNSFSCGSFSLGRFLGLLLNLVLRSSSADLGSISLQVIKIFSPGLKSCAPQSNLEGIISENSEGNFQVSCICHQNTFSWLTRMAEIKIYYYLYSYNLLGKLPKQNKETPRLLNFC